MKCFSTFLSSTNPEIDIAIFLNFLKVLIHNSDKYREEVWNKIKGFWRLEQYRKVHFYNKGSPNSDSEVLGSISNNFYEEVFEYAMKLKNEVIIQLLHLKIQKYIFIF